VRWSLPPARSARRLSASAPFVNHRQPRTAFESDTAVRACSRERVFMPHFGRSARYQDLHRKDRLFCTLSPLHTQKKPGQKMCADGCITTPPPRSNFLRLSL